MLFRSGNNAEIVKLRLLLLRQEKLFEQEMDVNERSRQFIIADNEFHRLIFNSIGKDSLWNIISQTTPHYQRFRAINNLQDEEVIKKLFEEHKHILMLLEDRDKESLRALYNKHIYGGAENMAEIISKNESFFVIE